MVNFSMLIIVEFRFIFRAILFNIRREEMVMGGYFQCAGDTMLYFEW